MTKPIDLFEAAQLGETAAMPGSVGDAFADAGGPGGSIALRRARQAATVGRRLHDAARAAPT